LHHHAWTLNQVQGDIGTSEIQGDNRKGAALTGFVRKSGIASVIVRRPEPALNNP
jgi:hypothetical protein